ncbi:MAG: cyclic-phosphate processing receiver domain-containing protein [Actinomycetota bacterium]
MNSQAQYVAVLEDDERRELGMRPLLATLFPEQERAFFDNAPDMLVWLQDHFAEVALFCLDHDLGPNRTRDGEVFDPGCGRDVADYLAAREPICPVVIHTTNSHAAPGMVSVLETAGWRVARVVPFSDLEWLSLAWEPTLRNATTSET